MRLKILSLTLIIALSGLLSSCVYYSYESDLEVSVKGLFSGNPRSGIIVQLFYSRDDAERLYGAVTPTLETDAWGEVYIYGLEPGVNYYVRIDTFLNTKIRRSGTLRAGTNSCSIRIL